MIHKAIEFQAMISRIHILLIFANFSDIFRFFSHLDHFSKNAIASAIVFGTKDHIHIFQDIFSEINASKKLKSKSGNANQ